MLSIAWIRTASRSGACGGNEARSARMSKPRPPCGGIRSGGNDRGGEQIRRREHKEIPAALEKTVRVKSCSRVLAGSRPDLLWGKADDTGEETGMCTPWDRRGTGSGIRRMILRDNVGNIPPVAGADGNLRRLLERGQMAEGEESRKRMGA